MKTAVFYEHILEGAKQSGKSVAELMEKCASWNIRGIEIGDALHPGCARNHRTHCCS